MTFSIRTQPDTAATASPTAPWPGSSALLRLHQSSAGLGIVVAVGMAVIGSMFTTTDGPGRFQHPADAWFTATGVAIGLVGLAHGFAVHGLTEGRSGIAGRIGVWLYCLCCAGLAVQCLVSVLLSTEEQWGPTYILLTLGTFVGLVLLVVGSWRTAPAPRWLMGLWPPVWVLGSFASTGPTPLLLVALYVGFCVTVPRHRAPRSR